jgi:hypothetical protein
MSTTRLEDLTIDAPLTTPDGKEVITLEEYLGKYLKHPDYESQALRLNSTSILKVLGILAIGVSLTRRTAVWLRANGYTATHNGQVFKVSMRCPPIKSYHVV